MIVKNNHHPKFKKLQGESKAYNENNDCAVKAVAVVTGISYAEAHAALKAEGRKDRDGTYNRDTKAAIKKLGFDCENVPYTPFVELLHSKGWTVKNLTTKTLSRYMKDFIKAGLIEADGTYLVSTNRHILGVDSGQVIDWSESRSLRVNVM